MVTLVDSIESKLVHLQLLQNFASVKIPRGGVEGRHAHLPLSAIEALLELERHDAAVELDSHLALCQQPVRVVVAAPHLGPGRG